MNGVQAEMLEKMDPEELKRVAPHLSGMDPNQIKMMSQAPQPQLGHNNSSGQACTTLLHDTPIAGRAQMMAGMDPSTMKSMARMAQQMNAAGTGPRVPPSAAAGSSSESTIEEVSTDGGSAGVPGMPGGSNMAEMMQGMDMGKGLDMMSNMSPEMMQAGVDMMKNMDPKAMAGMSKMLGCATPSRTSGAMRGERALHCVGRAGGRSPRGRWRRCSR